MLRLALALALASSCLLVIFYLQSVTSVGCVEEDAWEIAAARCQVLRMLALLMCVDEDYLCRVCAMLPWWCILAKLKQLIQVTLRTNFKDNSQQ